MGGWSCISDRSTDRYAIVSKETRRQSAEWTGGAVVVNECASLCNRRPCILIQVAALKEYLYMTLDTEGID